MNYIKSIYKDNKEKTKKQTERLDTSSLLKNKRKRELKFTSTKLFRFFTKN